MKNVPYFRGVFMRDNLPKRVNNIEAAIVNLDLSSGPGTHWVAYFKYNNDIEYFDSFGNLPPPKEIIQYLGQNIKYNHKRYQSFKQSNCGHHCVKFLLDKYISTSFDFN